MKDKFLEALRNATNCKEVWDETGPTFIVDTDFDQSAEASEQIADDFAIRFAEWAGKHYIKFHGGWMAQYADQRDLKNLKPTAELLAIFKSQS